MDGDFIKVTTVILFFGALLTLIIWGEVKTKARLSALCDSGFSMDHLLNARTCYVVFDDTKRRLAFVFFDETLQFDYATISQWSWQWKEKGGSHVKDWIVFYLLDKERPLIKVPVNRRDAELWDAKLGAILNG